MQKTVEHKKGISGSTLKWIAVISMLIDHVACVLLGKILVNNGIYSVGDISTEYIQSLIEQGSIGFVYLAYQIMRRIIGRLAFSNLLLLFGGGAWQNKKQGEVCRASGNTCPALGSDL